MKLLNGIDLQEKDLLGNHDAKIVWIKETEYILGYRGICHVTLYYGMMHILFVMIFYPTI